MSDIPTQLRGSWLGEPVMHDGVPLVCETLYTVVSREDKYKAKAFIDTFVYRAGDQLGAWSTGLLMWLGLSMSAIAFAAVPVAGIWMVVGYWLGRRQTEMLRSAPASGDDGATPAPAAG